MLPCDLPWWPAVIKQLDKAASARNSDDLINVMQRLHDMCKYDLLHFYTYLCVTYLCMCVIKKQIIKIKRI